MPVQEAYREMALSKLRELGEAIRPKVRELLEKVDPEDLEFGLKLQVKWQELEEAWREKVEENNYMEVVHTEIMEHHDGAYLKATFRNSYGDYQQERYVSVRSSGRVEVSHALFVYLEGLRVRVESLGGGAFELYVKAR
ncbi:MAG: hypothetical protein N3C13_05165 [Aquificaceae bacterium]|nr:hypothetical protein [Aquificaceae bacterium]